MTALPVVVVWGLKATPILLGAWIVTALLHRQSAATRHFVWVLATGCALVLPFATGVAPRLEVTLPAFQPATAAPLAFDAPARLSAPPAPTAFSQTTATGLTAPSADTAASAPSTPFAWTALATPVWATGAALLLLLVGVSMWRAARLAAKARPLTVVGVAREATVLARTLGIRRRVLILEADRNAMPMTWGAVRPRLLVPEAFATWPAPRRRAVLLHELAHVKRWDWLTQLAARLACALYWWHPLVWVAARQLREERELACDDLVLAHGTLASTYAADLLEIARAFRVSPATALAGIAMARRSQLAGRLRAVLDAARSRASLGAGQVMSATAAAVVLLLPVAGLAAGPDGVEADLAADRGGTAVFEATAPAVAVVASSEPAGPPARPPAQSRSAMLCDWTAQSGSSSSSTNINDERTTIQISRDDCTITVRAEGELTFSDDDRDLVRISRGGFFEIEERTGRTRRRVEIGEAGGQLERRWFVDSREQAYGDDARAWLGDALIVLARRAGINAEARAIRILTTQGEDALIAEIALLQSDHVAGQYYRVLFERGKLSSAQVSRLLTDAGERIESDHELGRVLGTVAARGPMDAEVQRSYVRATNSLESDHEHGKALQGLVTAGTLDTATLDAVLTSAGHIESDHTRAGLLVTVAQRYPADRALPVSYLTAVGDMQSDHERGRVLTQLLERDDVSAAERARVLGVVSRIGSDHTRSQVLIGVAAEGPLDDVTRDAFFAAVRGIKSDHSRQQVLQAALAAQADEATVLAVIGAAREIASDHSKAEVLTAVAANGRMSDRVRTAYVSAAQAIGSRYERDRAMRAAGLQGA